MHNIFLGTKKILEKTLKLQSSTTLFVHHSLVGRVIPQLFFFFFDI
jgi:hypothetical protein